MYDPMKISEAPTYTSIQFDLKQYSESKLGASDNRRKTNFWSTNKFFKCFAQCSIGSIQQDTLNATATAVCNTFEKFLNAPNVGFSPIIKVAQLKHT